MIVEGRWCNGERENSLAVASIAFIKQNIILHILYITEPKHLLQDLAS